MTTSPAATRRTSMAKVECVVCRDVLGQQEQADVGGLGTDRRGYRTLHAHRMARGLGDLPLVLLIWRVCAGQRPIEGRCVAGVWQESRRTVTSALREGLPEMAQHYR